MQHALNHSTAHSFKGSVEYIAPEVIVAGWCREGSRYLLPLSLGCRHPGVCRVLLRSHC